MGGVQPVGSVGVGVTEGMGVGVGGGIVVGFFVFGGERGVEGRGVVFALGMVLEGKGRISGWVSG